MGERGLLHIAEERMTRLLVSVIWVRVVLQRFRALKRKKPRRETRRIRPGEIPVYGLSYAEVPEDGKLDEGWSLMSGC